MEFPQDQHLQSRAARIVCVVADHHDAISYGDAESCREDLLRRSFTSINDICDRRRHSDDRPRVERATE